MVGASFRPLLCRRWRVHRPSLSDKIPAVSLCCLFPGRLLRRWWRGSPGSEWTDFVVFSCITILFDYTRSTSNCPSGAAVVTVTQICLQGDGRESSTTPSLDRQRQEDFRLLPKPNDWTNVFDKPSYTPSSSGSLNSVSLKPPLELRTLDFNRTFPLSRWIVSAVFGWHRRSRPAFCFGATCLAQRREARFRAGVRC